ncbi:MAG: metal-binding protein [Lachnospiraceae bacterium]|nr:metal-binding protein [Lachnospiraceae bacterium]
MEDAYKFFENKQCEYYPCHENVTRINCLFCFCPLYNQKDCPGNPSYIEYDGVKRKCCKNCTYPHRIDNYEKLMTLLNV